MTRIFLDDERLPPGDHDGDWVILRSFNDTMKFFAKLIHEQDNPTFPEYISFDHDLGENQPTGYDVAKKMVELDMDGDIVFPDNFSWTVHSMNPVGKENIDLLLQSYMGFREQYYGERD